MTAQEARLISNNRREKSNEKAIEILSKDIKLTTKKGKYFIQKFFLISNETKEYFENLGYYVRVTKSHNNYPIRLDETFISWE